MTSGWPSVSLGDICELKYGKALPKGSRSGVRFGVYGSNGEVGRHDESLTAGTTIVIGRKGSFGEVAYSAEPCWPIDTTYYVDGTATDADLRWLYYRLKALRLTELNRAAAIPGLNRDDAYAQPLLLPPIEEQRRIARVMDAADELRAKRRRAIAKLDDLVRAIFIAKFGDLAQYDVVAFGSLLAEPLRNGISPAKSGAVTGKVLTLSAITGSEFDPSAVKESTFKKRHAVDKTVTAEDFLICRGNGNLALVGRGKRPDQTMPDVAFPDTMIAARCDLERIAPGYLDHLWDGPMVRRQLETTARTTNGTHKINQTMIESVLLPLPSIAIQREFGDLRDSIASQTDRAMREAERLEVLFAALQQRAFRGEL